jgi:hypothetical protein
VTFLKLLTREGHDRSHMSGMSKGLGSEAEVGMA